MATKLLPITILTGFLGSGKTTLLRALLSDSSLRGTLVLMNEVGEIGIDHLLVRHVTEEIVLLDSGCLCCTLRRDLVDQLAEISSKAAQGEFQAIERVLIETTGLAEPAPILSTLLTHPTLADAFYVDGVVVTVDAQLGMRTLNTHPESEKQLGAADRVVVTKVDLVDRNALTQVLAAIRTRRGDVEVLLSDNAKLDASVLRGLGHLDTRQLPLTKDHEKRTGAYQSLSKPHERHEPTVATVALELEGLVEFRSFALWVSMLTQLHGEHVLRLKAIVFAKGEDLPLAVQAVQHVVYPTLVLPPMPELEQRSRVVLITRGLGAEDLEQVRRDLLSLVQGQLLR